MNVLTAISSTKSTDLSSRKFLKLKPFHVLEYPTGLINYSYYEKMDLKDLRNAAIKDLAISHEITLTKTICHNLTELLSNSNIKKVILLLTSLPKNNWLIFISNLIKKNSNIIDIGIEFDNSFSLNKIQRLVWLDLINLTKNKIVNVQNAPFSKFETDLNELIFSNSKLKEISLLKHESETFRDNYSNLLKYILSSNKQLDEFKINELDNNLNQTFFDIISKLESRAEINTLIIETGLFAIIDNSHLFKIETIICDMENCDSKKIFDHLFKLSNNPLNTVKRIIIRRKRYTSYMESISELLNSDLYDIKKLPQLFIEDYKEVVINISDNNKKEITCLYVNSKFLKTKENNFKLLVKENSIDEDSFTELLFILFNAPQNIDILNIAYSDKEEKKNTSNSQSIINNTESINGQIREMFTEFKANHTHFKSSLIFSLEFIFNENTPEFNAFYFTLLEIIIEMNIRINHLVLTNCSFTELANFMTKNKELESLSINEIFIFSKKKEMKDVDKLYQFPHLIKGKIMIHFTESIDVKNESDQIELIGMYDSQFRKNHNYVDLNHNYELYSRRRVMHKFEDDQSIKDFVVKIRNIRKRFNYENNFCFQNISRLKINFEKNLNLQVVSTLFSLFKEYQYVLKENCFLNLEKCKSNFICKINYMYLETIIDTKYRETEVYDYSPIVDYPCFKRRSRKYLSLHNMLRKRC